MVPRESAVCSVSKGNNRIEIRADHSRMVKFWSESDEHYQRVMMAIKEMMENHEAKFSETSFPPIKTIAPNAFEMIGVATTDQPHFMVPFPKNEEFIGESLIASRFKAHQTKRIKAGQLQHTGHFRLAMCGLGGIGYVPKS
jgi:hypothetical protein